MFSVTNVRKVFISIREADKCGNFFFTRKEILENFPKEKSLNSLKILEGFSFWKSFVREICKYPPHVCTNMPSLTIMTPIGVKRVVSIQHKKNSVSLTWNIIFSATKKGMLVLSSIMSFSNRYQVFKNPLFRKRRLVSLTMTDRPTYNEGYGISEIYMKK